MKKSYFVWVVLSIGIFFLGVVFTEAPIAAFVYIPAITIVVLAPALLLAGIYGLPAFGRSFKIAFSPSAASLEELKIGARLFASMQRLLVLTGIITTMFGLVAILTELEDASRLGPNLALAMITLLYSLMLIFTVAIPFKNALENRIDEVTESHSS